MSTASTAPPQAPQAPQGAVPGASQSLSAAQVQGLQHATKASDAPVSKVRFVLAYALWLFGGWFGLHRFFLGRWFTGLLYVGTFGFLGIGWLIDAFLIPKMLRGSSSPLDEQEPEDVTTEGQGAPVEQILAPWAKERKGSLLFRMQLLVGGLFLLFAPAIMVAFAILFDQWSLLVVMVGVLLFTNFLEQVRQVLETREEQVQRLPMMKSVIRHFNGFYEYYMVHRPRGFLFYLFYFPVGLLSMIFSKQSRAEGKLYLRVFAAIAAALIMATLSSYRNVYGGYVPTGAIAGFLFANLAMLFISVFFYVMPTMTTAFSFSLSGRRRSLKVLTFVSLIFALFLGAIGIANERGGVPILSRSILVEKFKHDAFHKDFKALTAMVFSWEARGLKAQSKAWEPDLEIRRRFRGYAANLTAGPQANAFHVFRFAVKPGQKPHLVLLLQTARERSLLAVASPKGQVYTSWKMLPKGLKEALQRTPAPPLTKKKRDRDEQRALKSRLLAEFQTYAKGLK